MRIKHRIPSIFNLSMVDVLCCALGCVILLWLLNLRAAKQSAVAAGRAGAELTETRRLLAESRNSAETLTAQLDATQRDLDAARRKQADLDRMIAGLRGENAAAAERLARKTQEHSDLARDLAETRKGLTTLEALVREKESLLRNSTRRAGDLDARLADAETRAKQMQLLADQVPGLKDETRRYRARLDAAKAQARALEKDIAGRKHDLDEASRRLERLQGERRAVADELTRLRESADNRFAGISLTGRRVVFLVDMSGSMELVDERTPAPEKWTGVRATLARILKSLPDLEKFQVILFSEQTSYLLGGDGSWLTYDPKTSVDRATRALAAVTPTGNTNMSAAFEAAFRYRSQGLDTVYVLSDGLPNIGAGLDEYAARNLKETERAEILGAYVRKMLRTDWNRPITGRPRVRINAVGFFYESPDVGAFLWALARENDGSFVGMSKP